MELTKEFVNSCRKVGVLRDFLCQAIDQVDEKDKEIAELKVIISQKEDAINKAVDIGYNIKKERDSTQRALWMARKAHAVAMFAFWDSHYRDNPNAVYRNRTVDWLRNRWLLILDSIKKKEKEYK